MTPAPDCHRRQPARWPLPAVVLGLTGACLTWASLSFVSPRSGGRVGSAAATRRQALMEKEAPAEATKGRSSNEWRLGVGRAIDVLRKDTVELFSGRPYTPDTSIYSENIKVVDARLPSFQLKGLASYERVLSTLQWSVRNGCESSKMEITSMTPPVNNVVYMRWRLKLVPKDPLKPARGYFATNFGMGRSMLGMDEPFIVEGYSNYEFDPWSAEIVQHTLDITNPPTYIMDVLRNIAQTPIWSPQMARVPTPFSMRTAPNQASLLTGGTASAQEAERPVVARTFGVGLSLPQSCEDDYECNDGKANYPLQCCEYPLVGAFCCDPDDFSGGTPAWQSLPVPMDGNPWGPQQGQQGRP